MAGVKPKMFEIVEMDLTKPIIYTKPKTWEEMEMELIETLNKANLALTDFNKWLETEREQYES